MSTACSIEDPSILAPRHCDVHGPKEVAAGRGGGTQDGRRPRSAKRSAAELKRRAEVILRREPQYVYHSSFEDRDQHEAILSPMPESHGRDRRLRPTEDADFYIARLYEVPLLSREQEAHLFRKFNYLKFRAHRLRQTLNPDSPSRERVEAIEWLEDEANRIRNHLVRANLRLLASLAKKFTQYTNARLDDLMSEGHLALIRAVEKFDFARGNKFSTYATGVLKNGFLYYLKREHRYSQRRVHADMVVMADSLEDDRAPLVSQRSLRDLRSSLAKLVDGLDERERKIIERRFGLAHDDEPQTLPQIGRELGVSKERVRQLQLRAIGKLRDSALEAHLEPPE